jgi:HEAT repeat protein
MVGMDDGVRQIMKEVAEKERLRRRDGDDVWIEAQPLLTALAAAGVDPIDFGRFGWASFSQFDFKRAVPVIIEWLPLADDPKVKEAMVRSLAGQPAAQGEGARRLLAEFRRPEYADASSLRWTIGDAMASLAGPADADAIIEILCDRANGHARQMFCNALVRSRDARRVDVLIELIDHDDVAGHAISALRRTSSGRRVPQPQRVRPKLEALIARPSATPFGKRMARGALKAMSLG